jgi:SAM-dependent methyltransferase
MLGKLAGRILDPWIERFRKRHGILSLKRSRSPLFVRKNGERLLLHVGCGHARKQHIFGAFQGTDWREVRLDADPEVLPDVVGTMTDLGIVPDGSFDALYSSHGIEHLYWHEVPSALAEFKRVLNDNGFLVITCPDLQAAAEWIAEDRVFETAYVSSAGEITPFDLVYSYRPFVAANPRWMAHHCGFTLSTLTAVLREAGFESLYGFRRKGGFDLWVLASKQIMNESELTELAKYFLPVNG